MNTKKPFLEKTNLFEARKGGYYTYRIPGIVVTKKGVVLAYTESRKGRGGDWDPIDILMRRSLDGGKTWEPPRIVAEHSGYGEGPVNNFVAIPDRNTGEVHVVYCYNYARAFYMKSADDGSTFCDPLEITDTFEQFRSEYEWNVIGAGPGHGIQLANGRLLVPVWISSGGKRHRPSIVSVIYSDDCGKTWQRGDIVVRHTEAVPNVGEPIPVELEDGRVLLNIRNESRRHRRLVSISPNGIRNWSEPKFDEALLEPQCMASICRLTKRPDHDKSRIIFANPDTLDETMPGRWTNAMDRKNVTVKLSYDECGSWPVSKVLEAGPSGYTDLAIAPDGAILCLYERGCLDQKMADTQYLALARFNLEWLTDGKDSV